MYCYSTDIDIKYNIPVQTDTTTVKTDTAHTNIDIVETVSVLTVTTKEETDTNTVPADRYIREKYSTE